MHLVLLAHPEFLGLRSQSLYAQMLLQGCRARGHTVELRQPEARLFRWLQGTRWAKWAGYFDQYLLFAAQLKRQARTDPPHTLYVFCDQALGPWVPLLAHRPHVVHCHDLLALRSALGEIPEHATRFSGRVYQRYIRRGFSRARHFICISSHTRAELLRVGLPGRPAPRSCEVVPNGLAHPYARLPAAQAHAALRAACIEWHEAGGLLHVGGGQWYKNTTGVVALYAALARRRLAAGQGVPALYMVGPPPSTEVQTQLAQLPAAARVFWHQGLSPQTLQALYSLALALLFPSLAEGFGWPIAEALACGCPVVTTGAEPMTEVGGTAPLYLPLPASSAALPAWASAGAFALQALLDEDPDAAAARRCEGLAQAARYDPALALEACLRVYARVLQVERHPTSSHTP